MSSIDLTQEEANRLLEIKKYSTEDRIYDYPNLGGKIAIPLTTIDKKESFYLDIVRGSINLKKGSYQNRVLTCISLARLDFNGPPHRNPDGEELPSTHIHLYKEGFGDKWAYKIPKNKFSNIKDFWIMLEDFCKFCYIVEPPKIRKGLFT